MTTAHDFAEPAPPEIIADLIDPEILAAMTDPDRPFSIEDDESAEWALGVYRSAQARIADQADLAARYRARIDTWFEELTSADRQTVDRMADLLATYAIRRREETDDRVKTVTLPSGKVKTRGSTQPVVKIDDQDEVLAWAQDNLPDVVTTVSRVLVTDLRTHAHPAQVPIVLDGGALAVDDAGEPITEWVAQTADGNIVPGVVVDLPAVTVSIEVAP